MKTFQIGNFLTAEGRDLTWNLAAGRVEGFSRLKLSEDGVTVEFDTAVQAEDRPGGVPRLSTIEFRSDDIESREESTFHAHIELEQDQSARVSFHWPNPLTPIGAGLFFRLGLARTGAGYRLSFRNNAVRDHGFMYFRQDSAWPSVLFAGPGPVLRSLAEWRDPLVRGFAVADAASRSLRAGALLSGAEAALFEAERPPRDWRFLLRLAPAAQGRLRLIAMVRDGDSDEEREALAVSTRALRLEERPDIRPRPLWWRRTIFLSCASALTEDAAEPSVWFVDWSGAPTFDLGLGGDHFSLRGFWQELARHWPLGLRSLRSQNALTFFPTDLSAGDPGLVPAGGDRSWTFRFQVDRAGGPWRSRLARVGSALSMPVRFELASVLNSAGRPCAFESAVDSRFTALAAASTGSETSLLQLQLGASPAALGQLLVGGILLDLDRLKDSGNLEVSWVEGLTGLGQPPLRVSLKLTVEGRLPRPATEDPERGFETENDLLRRERSLVVDLKPAAGVTELEVREQAAADRSRVLELTVRNAQEGPVRLEADTVVVDPGPFLVARVLAATEDVEPRALLAAYRDDGERPPGWELRTDTGAMTLVLPPQAIGEEMIKGRLTVDQDGQPRSVPFEDRPFDFRLSPPARLELDRTDVDTARAAAPWTLRRLLDRREGVVGLKLDQARFELLYGLRASLERPEGLRVAEQDAFVGRVPLAPDVRDRLQERLGNDQGLPTIEQEHAGDFVSWVRGLRARPAQLPVFRDFAARERLVLSRGLRFELRESRQTANPLRVGKYHPPVQDTDETGNPRWDETEEAPPAPDGRRLPLRGGVDYPFESRNIYGAVIDEGRTPVASPGEPQGQIAGLVFGALGGGGSQQASFDEGRTLIISDTTQGRLNSLTLVRVGRIALLWNHARHVIVYERTTRTAPRYRDLQPDRFEGLAALRKIKEYIEITQPRRVYPDLGAAPGERPLAGPLTASFFETVVIPVKSSWGRDIDGGWVMALRGPLSPQEEPFYPSPKIFLELARAESKGGGSVSQQASDPSQLFFFTTTRQGLGGDPDAWPPWPDVDVPLTHRPKPPELPFLPGFGGARRQPDAAEHDFGQREFTIDVIPAEEAVNLMHGRPGDGLEARVRNVSLARGQMPRDVRSVLDETVGSVFAGAEARLSDGFSELAQHLERLAQQGAGRTAAEVAGLREQGRALLDRMLQDAGEIQRRVAGANDLLNQGVENWVTIQERWARDAGREWEKALDLQRGLPAQLQGTLDGVLARLRDVPDTALTPDAPLVREAENRLRGALEAVCRQAAQRLESTPFLPEEVLERLRAELGRAETEVNDLLARMKAGWLRLVDELVARFATEGPRALRAELIAALLDSRARVVALGADFARQVKNRLGPLFGDLPGGAGAIGRLTALIQTVVDTLTRGIDQAVEAIPPFEPGEPDWEALRELFRRVEVNVAELFAQVRGELLAELETRVDAWRRMLRERIAAFEDDCRDQAGRLVTALGRGVEELRREVERVVDEWGRHVRDAAGALVMEAANRFTEIRNLPAVREIEGAIDRALLLQNEVVARIQGLQRDLDQATRNLRELADQAREAARQAGAGLRRIGEQIEQAVTRELRGSLLEIEGTALELARSLAEGPVTDTLRCTRDWVGYYYDAARDALDVTRAAALFNDLGGNVLNSLAAQVPFDRIRDRILPQLADFDLSKLFPDFAGLKLEHLLGGLRVPRDPFAEYDWIKVRHGFDRARLTAWSEVAIDKRFDGTPELFTLPPVSLQVSEPRFTARSRVEVSQDGVQAQQTEAQLLADWIVTLNGQPVMTITRGGLFFDSRGGFRFDFEAKDLRLAPALQFVTDAFRDLLPQGDGLTLTPLFPGGISAELSLPLPDIGTGAFTLTGITLYSHFDLLVAGGFEVRTGLWLSRPERPFGLAVLFLGGGGWFGIDVRYKPPREFETRVSVGVSAGAFVALNFGVARGSAGILFTAGLDFYRNWLQSGTQDLAISIGLLVWGELSILSIVSAYLRVVLRVEYRNGEMTGYGRVSVSIKICWCFTLRVDAPINLPFKRSGNRPEALEERPAVADALDAHFANLDL